MKKYAALICTLALLTSLSACGVEKPDLEAIQTSAKSSEGSGSASAKEKETEKKKITRKDSHIKGDLAKNFHVDADITGEKTSLPTYYLNKINLTEDQIAEKLMSTSEYIRNDTEDGLVSYVNSKTNERLAIDLNGKFSSPDSPTPNLTYGGDKGKEYEAAVKFYSPYESLESEAANNAAAQVKAMLDKLSIQYHDFFHVEKMNYDFMNEIYAEHADPIAQPDIPAELQEKYDEMASAMEILTLAEGKDAKLDKNFKFKQDDSCFVVMGNLKVNDLEIKNTGFKPYCITAAVSSRGVEYLYIEDLYIPDNGSSESPIITPEQAIEAVYKDYAASPNKDKYEMYINNMSLGYTNEPASSDISKVKLRPVWHCDLNITNLEHGYAFVTNCDVYADTGEMPYELPEYYPESGSEESKES
jgi:hypothetical protein